MNTCSRAWNQAVHCLATALTFCLISGSALAQNASATFYEAPFMGVFDGQTVRKGTAQGALDGDMLRLFVVYSGFNPDANTVVEAHLFRGDPTGGGERLQNLAIMLGYTGGFDVSVTLTQDLLDDMQKGRLYVQVRTALIDPWKELHGPLQVSTAPDLKETPLSHIHQGYPVARGGARALVTDAGLRVLGYFNGLSLDWKRISLYRGGHGTEAEHLTSIYNTGPDALHAGFDLTCRPRERAGNRTCTQG